LRAGIFEEAGRIALVQPDILIGFPRAEQVLNRLQSLTEAPRHTAFLISRILAWTMGFSIDVIFTRQQFITDDALAKRRPGLVASNYCDLTELLAHIEIGRDSAAPRTSTWMLPRWRKAPAPRMSTHRF
jgi:hypothetical protein